MAKGKENLICRAKKIIGNSTSFTVESTNGETLIFCKLCSIKFKIDAVHLKTQYTSHIKSLKHKKSSIKGVLQPSITSAIATTSANNSKTDSYSIKLVTAILEAGIPIWKLHHPSIKKFFLEQHNEVLSSANTYYNKIEVVYTASIQAVKEYIGENPIYLVADETPDKKRRDVLNILVGKLDGTPSKTMLLCTLFLDATNNVTVQQGVHKACSILYGVDVPFEKLWLFISDQAPYMLTAGRGLKGTFPNLKHVTCLVHALNRVCETIKDEYELVNDLIAGMKGALCKSKNRRQKFTEICKIPFPPDVIEIRWNSWLNAAFYYAKNFSAIKSFVHALGGKSKSVKRLKMCIDKKDLERELLKVNAFTFLTNSITRLENRGLTVSAQMEIVSAVKRKLSGVFLDKIKSSLSKNPDLYFFESMPVDQQIKCNFAPMTSVDAERSFSTYRYILSDKRHNLSDSNLAMLNVIQYNINVKECDEENL